MRKLRRIGLLLAFMEAAVLAQLASYSAVSMSSLLQSFETMLFKSGVVVASVHSQG